MNYIIIPTRDERRNELRDRTDVALRQTESITESALLLTEFYTPVYSPRAYINSELRILNNLVGDHDSVLTHFEDFHANASLLIAPRLKLDNSLVNRLARIQNRERQFLKMLAICAYTLHEYHNDNSLVANAVNKLHDRITNIAKRTPYGLRYDLLNRHGHNEEIYKSNDGSQLAYGDFIALNIGYEDIVIDIFMKLSALCNERWLYDGAYRDRTIVKAQNYGEQKHDIARKAKTTFFGFYETLAPEHDVWTWGIDFYA